MGIFTVILYSKYTLNELCKKDINRIDINTSEQYNICSTTNSKTTG